MQNQPDPQKQLELIEQTIRQAKNSFYKGSFHYLAWGWALAIAGIAQFLLAVMGSNFNWIPWPAVAIMTGSVVAFHEKNRTAKKKEPMDRIFSYIWGGFGATLAIMIVMTVINQINPNPYVIVLSGLPTFISGGMLRSNILIIGAGVFWAFGIASFFMPSIFTSLALSAALIFGWVIPGHILRRQEQKEMQESHG